MLNRSWLELPETLTALLIPLPYLFASLAYPSVVAQARKPPSPLSDAATESNGLSSQSPSAGGQLLHACTLSSTTLILVGLISKIRSTTDQPLDRRKSFGSSETPGGGTLHALLHLGSLWRIITTVLSVLLPFYATMQLGGARAAVILLAATAAGLGSFDQKLGKHTTWENLKRTVRTRKWTCAVLGLGLFADFHSSADASGTVLGYLALAIAIAAIPLPLPTAGWYLMTGSKSQDAWNTHSSTRASLPKPSSPLTNTPQETLLTLASGLALALLTVLYSSIASSAPSLSRFAIFFSTLSVASATGLVYFSLPAALRSKKKGGLALGSFLVAAFEIWGDPESWQAWVLFPTTCVFLFAAIALDTHSSALARPHSHGHSHAHEHHDHHLHGNHSKLSAFLIARCTPGSITHSILIEKDSRRIAYFGM